MTDDLCHREPFVSHLHKWLNALFEKVNTKRGHLIS